MTNNTNNKSKLDRPGPRLKTSACPIGMQDGHDKYATATLKTRTPVNIGTWNVRTLRPFDTKVNIELQHTLKCYKWNILGLAEMRYKGNGEMTTSEGHKIYYSGSDKHQYGVGFIINKANINCVINFKPISDRLALIRIQAKPFNITLIQVYAPTSSNHTEEETDEFYNKLQMALDHSNKHDIKIVLGDFNAKIGKDSLNNYGKVIGSSCNATTNENGQKLLDFITYNQMVAANTLGIHKPSRIHTWKSPDGKTSNQIDYILVSQRFRSAICTASTRAFPKADIYSDHNLVLMKFKVHLKKQKKETYKRIKYDLDKLRDPNIRGTYELLTQEKIQAILGNKDCLSDINRMIEEVNTAIADTAETILGKQKKINKPWITEEILNLCDIRRTLKPKRNTSEGRKQYNETNRQIKTSIKLLQEKWITEQCQYLDDCIATNNTKIAYNVVKKLTTEKVPRSQIILDRTGKELTEDKEVLDRWTEYCSDLYNYDVQGNNEILNNHNSNTNDEPPILRSEVEDAMKSLKLGKSPGTDNIPAELLIAAGGNIVDVYTIICNHIQNNEEWPTEWTKSIIITIPKKGNIKLCNNYRTLSLINHASKIMLRVILNRLKPQAEHVLAEEQAGFRKGRSTTEQIFNINLLHQKYNDHQLALYYVFIDFKKAFDRVWQKALWATMHKAGMSPKLIKVINNLYDSAMSSVLHNGKLGSWFKTTTGVRQGCLLSPTLFNIFLEEIMNDALENFEGLVNVSGRPINNLRFADDIAGIASSNSELQELVQRIHESSKKYGMEISQEKTKVMTNQYAQITQPIQIENKTLEEVKSFKYLGATISDEGSKPEIMSRIAQANNALAKLQPIWKSQTIRLETKLKLMKSLVHSIFLYGSETWTINKEIEKRITAFENKCYRRILNIKFQDKVSNERLHQMLDEAIGSRDQLMDIIKRRKLKWYGHVTRGNGLSKTILQGTVQGKRKQGRPKKTWMDNIKEWTGMNHNQIKSKASNRNQWKELVHSINGAPTT